MTQLIIQANTLSLYDLQKKFGLQMVKDESFFPEWMEGLPSVTDSEAQALDRVKECYLHLNQRSILLEDLVKMVVLSRLLDLAGFYLPPFEIATEYSVELAVKNRDEVLKGRLDVLVLQSQLWVLAIESKQTKFDVTLAIPQALSYMLMSPPITNPVFGAVTNGREFIFIKLDKTEPPHYALSDAFALSNRRNELYDVLAVLKKLGALII